MDSEFFLDAGIPPLLNYNQPPIPTWHPLPPSETHFPSPAPGDGSSGGFFDSALSSMVSSPGSASNSAVSGERFAIRELIGKLGNICNPGEISPPANPPQPPYTPTCYTTPPNPDFFARPGNPIGPDLPAMPIDSGFAERAARFSAFRSRSFNCRTSQLGYQTGSGLPPNAPAHSKPGRKLQRVLSSPSLKVENEIDVKVNRLSGNFGADQGQSRNSTGSGPGSASRKRKSAPKANNKSKQIPTSPVQATQTRNDPSTKRIKSSEVKEDNTNEKAAEEPPKDYIHVRARRGQATDSHSLAERVRREKISERMKLLQDIVPGCNKVTGKALMLEEIINYVQSLQRQVEFLSMKLASTPPSMDFSTSNSFQNDIFQPNCSLQTSSMQLDSLTQEMYGAQNGGAVCTLNQSHEMQLPPNDAFINGVHEIPSLCEGNLHTIFEMGFSDNRLYTG